MVSAIVSSARTPRLDSLTSLRWWAALAVFFFHIRIVLGAIGPQHGMVGAVWIIVLLAASVLLAWGLHALVERPVESRLRRWQNEFVARRSARTSSAGTAATRPAIEEPEKK